MKRIRVVPHLAVVALLVLASACGRSGDEAVTTNEAGAVLSQVVGDRFSNRTSAFLGFNNLDELVPLTAATIVGQVTKVEPGRGFVVLGDDAPGGIAGPFDNPAALWKTLHLTVSVEEQIHGGGVGSTVQVGFAIDGDDEITAVSEALKGLGTVVLFLSQGSPVFDYDSGLFSIFGDGELITTVNAAGSLALPLADPGDVTRLLGNGADTLSELRGSVATTQP